MSAPDTRQLLRRKMPPPQPIDMVEAQIIRLWAALFRRSPYAWLAFFMTSVWLIALGHSVKGRILGTVDIDVGDHLHHPGADLVSGRTAARHSPSSHENDSVRIEGQSVRKGAHQNGHQARAARAGAAQPQAGRDSRDATTPRHGRARLDG